MLSSNLIWFNLILFSKSNHCYRFFHQTHLQSSILHLRKSNNGDSDILLRYLSERKLQEARYLLDEEPQRSSHHAIVQWTSMLSKYSRDGFIDEARLLFELMPERNIVTYNAMLSAYVQSGRISNACQFFEEMSERNVVSWTSMLHGLTQAGRITDAKEMFDSMPERNIITWNSMIVGLIRNGDLMEARRMFDIMPARDLVSWNVMIAGYAEYGRMEEARGLFDAMPQHNVVTWSTLIAGYCRVGDVKEAYYRFEKMPERNIVSWTAMIGGLAWNGFYEESLLLFLEMRGTCNVKPNEETCISLVYACSGLGLPRLGKQVHGHVILNGWDQDDYDGRLSKSLIYMYCEFGIMDFSHQIFTKNSHFLIVQSCNHMINGYIKIGLLEKARDLFEKVPIRDGISWTSMIMGYFNTGDVIEACRLFSIMPERDAIAWTVFISGHVQNELFQEAFSLFSEMCVNGIKPLDSTYSTLLGASGAIAHLDQGKQFHCQLIKTRSKLDIILENSLVSMYAKCGEFEIAYRIFADMTIRDTISWNSMIIGFSYHGLANESLKLFEAMLETMTRPNSVTFLGVLSACSHAGLVNRGFELFDVMSKKYGIQPGVEHYICMVDLLGRAGKAEKAEEFVMRMPFVPGSAVWGALLGICGLGEQKAGIVERAAQRLLELDPLNAPAHVLLCNIYAATDNREKEGMLRKEMGLKGVRKVPGCSWILLKGRVNVFLSGDISHPQADEIISLLVGYCGRNKV